MTKAEEFFNELSKEISGVKPSKMFGAACMKTPNGKSAAMFWKDNIVVKLRDSDFEHALSLNGAKLFEPMEGRPMKEWVQIPFKYKNIWKDYVILSRDIVKSDKKKTTKKKTKLSQRARVSSGFTSTILAKRRFTLFQAQDAFCFFQVASTSASRSGVRPARNFDCRSCGRDLNHASVSCAVSASGRNVKPLASARWLLIWLPPASSPRGGIHTGMSDHGSTFC